MEKMNALVFEKPDGIDALAFREVDYPKPAAGEVVVKVEASALNHRDVWITQGLYAGIKTPIILGSDGAGTVYELGENVLENWLHKPVLINPSLNWGDNLRAQQKKFRILGLPDNGVQAEFVCVPVENIVQKPDYLSFAEAAAIPLAGLTGYRALFTQGNLQAGQTVLITGIGGGVASLMLLMAVAAGANVLVTSGNEEKIERAKSAGAIGGANYRSDDWAEKISAAAGENGVDLIIDSAGGEGFDNLLNIVNPGGKIVFFGATAGNPPGINLRKIFWKQVTVQGTTMGTQTDFSEMVHFFEKHHIHPLVDGPFDWQDYPEAFRRMASGEQFGKIVVRHDVSGS